MELLLVQLDNVIHDAIVIRERRHDDERQAEHDAQHDELVLQELRQVWYDGLRGHGGELEQQHGDELEQRRGDGLEQ